MKNIVKNGLESQLAASVKLVLSETEARITSEKDQQLKEETENIRKSYETKAKLSEDKLINVRAETAKIEKAMLDYKSKFETMNCATLSAVSIISSQILILLKNSIIDRAFKPN